MEWTAESVKQAKPGVLVLVLGHAHPAVLTFCSPRVATATIQSGPRALEQYEFPWTTIAQNLNTGEALIPLR